MIHTWEIALRLLLAVLLGGIIGLERERHNRPAGLRTHVLVCTGSALLMMVSAYGFAGQLGPGLTSDPGRIAAGVVTGIGFLGAGTIMRQGSGVRGLTTAAGIWVVSGVGLAVGLGFYTGAVLTAVFVLASLMLLRRVEENVFGRHRYRSLQVRAVDRPGLLGRIGSVLGEMGISIRRSNLADPEWDEAEGAETIAIDFLLEPPAGASPASLFNRLYCLEGILDLSWEGQKPPPDEAPPS